MKLDPRTTALLVIDLQNDTVGEEGAFASSGAAAFATEHGIVARAAGLADAFRAAGAPAVIRIALQSRHGTGASNLAPPRP